MRERMGLCVGGRILPIFLTGDGSKSLMTGSDLLGREWCHRVQTWDHPNLTNELTNLVVAPAPAPRCL